MPLARAARARAAGGRHLARRPPGRTLPSPVRDTLVSDDDSAVYDEAADIIQEDYYRKVDRKQLLNKALGSAVDSLDDRFSAYFDPKAYRSFNEATQGAFEGVGMNVEEVPRGLRVLTVFKGSPAAKGGLKPGDEIIAVNGRSLRGASSEQATTRIKGRAGTEVTLTVVTGKQKPREVTLKRAHVDVPVVESRMTRSGDEKVAYVKLASFTSGAHGEVGKAVRRLLGKGAKAVVLDLRDNGGGLLNEAVLVSSIFIPEGKIVTTRGRSRPERVFEATGSLDQHQDPGRRAGQRRVRLGVGDRDRRAAGPRPRDRRRHAHVRQGRLPGDQAALQRRRARHHGRRVLHPQRPQPRRRRPEEGRRDHARRQGERQRQDQARRGARRRGQDVVARGHA